jgi:nucleotide-binding universal stress UspA family protein
MGWKGYTSTRDRIFGEVADQVVKHAPCDLITVKLSGATPLDSILMPTAGGPHASLAAEYVGYFQKAYNTKVVCCYVVPRGASEREREQAEQWIDKTLSRSGLEGDVEKRLVEANHVASGLVRAGAEEDMIILGASQEGLFSSVLLGEIPERIARHSRKPVMIVKRYEGAVKTLVKKILG